MMPEWYDEVDYDCERDIVEEPEPTECPECGMHSLRHVGQENYGEDRDGNRGVNLDHYRCESCEYECDSF